MIKSNNIAMSRICWLILLLFCAAGWQGCQSAPAPSLTDSSSGDSTKDVKDYSRWIEAGVYTDPPPTHGSDGKFLANGEVKSKLAISSLSQTAIVLTPLRDKMAVESIELAIYANGNRNKVFSLQALPAGNSNTFNQINGSSDSRVSGYVFNLDPQKIGEAEKYFVPENAIKLKPIFKLEKAATAILYVVNKDSEVKK